MKQNFLRLILLLLGVVLFSSCFEGRWAHYKHRSHYVNRKHYYRYHAHRNGDW